MAFVMMDDVILYSCLASRTRCRRRQYPGMFCVEEGDQFSLAGLLGEDVSKQDQAFASGFKDCFAGDV